MAKRVKATKTLNPLHFEDLEPHRFEDLVRRLLYSFRDWSNIEPTGRGGSDEGYDARAWEKDDTVTNVNDEGEEGVRSTDGRLWQIQVKREKNINPAKMAQFIRDGVDGKHPPHGYILAAATNITKTCFDVFRTELRKKGVREFYFWGKDHLEDQLAMPQNDEILFTFFGISLSPRRRSRISEIKFSINNKNKIQKILFGSDEPRGDVPRHQAFVLRDINDPHYPNDSHYPDFDTNRRWEEHDVAQLMPTGVFFKIREWYAYFDEGKREWDFTRAVDLTSRKHNIDKLNQARLEDTGKHVERFWRHLPLRLQAKLVLYGFVRFEDMLIIDEKGDALYSDPHILLEFGKNGPFSFTLSNLQHSGKAIGDDELEKLKRVSVFPSVFPVPTPGVLHELSALQLPENLLRTVRHGRGHNTLYGFDGTLDRLAEGDLMHVPADTPRQMEAHLEVTHIRDATVLELASVSESDRWTRDELQRHAGRDIQDTDRVRVCEVFSVMLPLQGNLPHYLDSSY